jgi:hypothetical protein
MATFDKHRILPQPRQETFHASVVHGSHGHYSPSLEVGVEYVRQTLGVSPQVGGEHPRMGTHNCLLKLGEKFYLEVISINPNAPRPNRPRWFQLDKPEPSIRLATWIARTDDIYAATTASPIPWARSSP